MKSESKTVTTNTFTVNSYPPFKSAMWKQWDDEWKKGFMPLTKAEKDYCIHDSWLIGSTITAPNISINAGIKRVIFNPPATIVYWQDGTKTVVKCTEDEIFNESAGVALCFMKRFCKDYKPTLKKAVKNAERPFKKAEQVVKDTVKFTDAFKGMADAFEKFVEKEIKKHGTDENNNDKGNK